MVPTTLYLPDGRTVPVCVVQVDPAEPDRDLLPGLELARARDRRRVPADHAQPGRGARGQRRHPGHRRAHRLRADRRHVGGPAGTRSAPGCVAARSRSASPAAQQLTRLPFTDVYPDLVGHRTYLTLDAGLVEVDELADWSSQIYGLPPAGPLADLSERNMGTRLINAEVIAYGAASG